jgi:hypothetical protein
MDGRLRIRLKCELEHGLHDGTMLEQFVQELALPGLSHSSVEQALRGSFHSTLSHNGSHNNYMACKRKYIMTLVSLPFLLATLKIPMISIPFFESQFLGSYDNEMCTT